MADERLPWEAWGVIGGAVTFMLEMFRRLVGWFKTQRQLILTQIEALRCSHEAHVNHMSDAHIQNSTRLVKLESNEFHNTERLKDLCQTVKEIDGKQDEQTKMIMSIMKQGRK